MSQYRYVLPTLLTSDEVEAKVGGSYKCPYCGSTTRPCTEIARAKWAPSAIRQDILPYICQGCFIDIYSTCLNEDFENHPYRSIVREAADIENLSLEEARRICIKDQVDIILKKYGPDPNDENVVEFREHALRLARNVQ